MKRFIYAILLCFISLVAKAQSGIYFDTLSETTQIGMGRSKNSPILAILQQTSKTKVPKIVFADQFGNEYYNFTDLKLDTVICYKESKVKYVEWDYRLKPEQIFKLYNMVKANDIVYIGKEKFSATVFVTVLQKLESTYNKPNLPIGRFFNMGNFMLRRRR